MVLGDSRNVWLPGNFVKLSFGFRVRYVYCAMLTFHVERIPATETATGYCFQTFRAPGAILGAVVPKC
jgi:hypothetical protein